MFMGLKSLFHQVASSLIDSYGGVRWCCFFYASRPNGSLNTKSHILLEAKCDWTKQQS